MQSKIQKARDALQAHLQGISGVGPVFVDDKRQLLEIRVESHVPIMVCDCLPSSWDGFDTIVTVKPSRVLTAQDRDYRDKWN